MKPEFVCECGDCQSACMRKPGWFLPGEIEQAAGVLGLTVQEFFDGFLGVDWWEADPRTYVLAPQTTHSHPGELYPFDPTGVCRLFEAGKCRIHEAKPYECAMSNHDDSTGQVQDRHKWVAEQWEEHKDKIEELLGYKPNAPEPELSDMFSMFGS